METTDQVINNEGALVFEYDLEDTDTPNGANVFTGQNSALWHNVRDCFPNDRRKMYQELRSGTLFNYETINNKMCDHQSAWPEALWNEDCYTKYVGSLLDKGEDYLEMLQGDKKAQRDWWLFNGFKYRDSKYNAGDALTNFITLRCYEVGNITVTPYVICESIEALEELHQRLVEFVKTIGIELSEKKCRIIPFRHHGFHFLKLRFLLTGTGKVVVRLGRKSIHAMRRKLNIFRTRIDEGSFLPEDCFTAYQSWRSHARRCDSYRTLCSMDRYFISLFSKELSAYRRPFKCLFGAEYIGGQWIYPDKPRKQHASKIEQKESRTARAYRLLREARKGATL